MLKLNFGHKIRELMAELPDHYSTAIYRRREKIGSPVSPSWKNVKGRSATAVPVRAVRIEFALHFI